MCCCDHKCRCKPEKPTTAKEIVGDMVARDPDRDKVHIAYGKDGQLIIHINGQSADYVLRPGDTLTLHLSRTWSAW
jgi:hypothetical protein